MTDKTTSDTNTDQKPIIHLTDAAIDKVLSMAEKDGKQGTYLRVGVVTGGCAGLSYELRFQKTPYDNDVMIDQGRIKVLINTESVPFIRGTEIHYIDTLKESGFQYKNPNATNSCGCGTSFS